MSETAFGMVRKMLLCDVTECQITTPSRPLNVPQLKLCRRLYSGS